MNETHTSTGTTMTHTRADVVAASAASAGTTTVSSARTSDPLPLTTPTEAGRAREIIESALREHHACGDCGQPMGIAEHGGKIWVECASLHTRTGLRHAITAAFHERHRLWLPTGELAAAA